MMKYGVTGGATLLGAAALLGSTMLTPALASEQSLEELKAQIDSLQAQVDELSAAQSQPVLVAPAQAVQAGDKPGSFKIPGTDTSLTISGYVKGDLIYDFNQFLGDTFAADFMAGDGSVADNRDGQFRAHARQSRLRVITSTPSDIGEVTTYIEGDFFNAAGATETFSNSNPFRLRQAFGQVGGLLVGQTWMLAMPLFMLPDTLDFYGPTGVAFARQGQIRYTFSAGPLQVAFSAENPEFVGGGASAFISPVTGAAVPIGVGSGQTVALDSAPDVTGAVQYAGEAFVVRLAGTLRALEIDDGGANAPAVLSDSEIGYAINAGARFNPFGNDIFGVNFAYGDGGGRYQSLLAGAVGHFLTAAGNIELTESWSVVAQYEHHWNDAFKSTLAFGFNDIDHASGTAADLEVITVHANIWWTLAPRSRVGLEYMYGDKEFAGGTAADNSANRLMGSLMFFF